MKYKNWCEISLNNLVSNYNTAKAHTNKRVICVIKADAYGHGAVKAAKALRDAGCDFFAVSSYTEALELREAGIDASVLILGRIMPWEIKDAVDRDISFAAGTCSFLKEVISCGLDGKKAKIHIKLNTGMNRTGFDTINGDVFSVLGDALKLINENCDLFDVEGVFSHFAKAEDDMTFSKLQFDRFSRAVQFIEKSGIKPKIRHICNSAGLENYPDFRLDAVRLGIYLYGCERDNGYKPVMSFHSRILEIKSLKKGDGVSYGLDYKAEKDTTIAITGFGYADGVHRSLSDGKGFVLCHGKKCPIVGRVCMDMLMIDLSNVPEAKELDTITLFGSDGDGYLSCTEQAQNAGTISYELLCSVSKRVPRIYM